MPALNVPTESTHQRVAAALEALYSSGSALDAAVTAVTALKNDAQVAANQAESARDTAEEYKDAVMSALPDSYSQLVSDVEDLKVFLYDDSDWQVIQRAVQMGFGEKLYPIGTEFEVPCVSGAPYDSIIFTVIGHDHDKKLEDVNAHTMTLLQKYVIYGRQFDNTEALYYAEDGLLPGTYYFTIHNYDATYGGNKSYQFNLVNAVPPGGQLVFPWGYNAQASAAKVSSYSSAESTTPIESVSVTEGTNGTFLGTTDGTSTNMNHMQRARYGSNNWEESAARQWLNSRSAANQWWRPMTKYDRPPSYANAAGYASYLDPAFYNVIANTSHLNRTNGLFDLNGTTQAYSTEEKFFLLSTEEVGFSTESGINTGSVYEFFNGSTNEDRIKYDISSRSTARHWWLRAPHPTTASHARYVYTSGALYYNFAYYGFGLAAACVIC